MLFGELDEGVCHPQCSCRSGIVWEWYRTAQNREVIRRIDLELGQRGAAPMSHHGKFGQDWSFKIDSEAGVLIPVGPSCRARLDLVPFLSNVIK